MHLNSECSMWMCLTLSDQLHSLVYKKSLMKCSFNSLCYGNTLHLALVLLVHIHFAFLRGGLTRREAIFMKEADYSPAGWTPCGGPEGSRGSAGKSPGAAGNGHGRVRPVGGAGIVPRHGEKPPPAPKTQNKRRAARRAKGTRFKNCASQYLPPRDVKEYVLFCAQSTNRILRNCP